MKTLLLIILIPFAVILLIGMVTKKYKNPYRLYLIFGKKGSGKSTQLCKIALKYLKKNKKLIKHKKPAWTIYTNMSDMSIPDVRIIDIKNLGDFVPVSNSILLLDEAGLDFDNRQYKNFSTSKRDFFVYQRHYKVICYLASQSYNVDKKLRDLCDGMFLYNCIFNVISLCRPIRKSITLTESTSEAESRVAENLKFKWIFSWRITFIPRYSKYFKSFVIPEKPELPYKEYD